MTVRMDNIGIVVEDLDGAIDFFATIGLELQGKAMVEGAWAGHRMLETRSRLTPLPCHDGV